MRRPGEVSVPVVRRVFGFRPFYFNFPLARGCRLFRWFMYSFLGQLLPHVLLFLLYITHYLIKNYYVYRTFKTETNY